MKVLLDGHMLGSNEGGNETYINNLSSNLVEDREIDLKVLVTKDFFKGLKSKDRKSKLYNRALPLPNEGNIFRLLYYIPHFAAQYKADIVHSTYITPLYKNSKFVVTVHDLSFKSHPEWYDLRERFLFNCIFPLSLKKADAIIVPSSFSRKELIKFYPQYYNKIYVIPDAAKDIFTPINKHRAVKYVIKKYKISPPFLLIMNSRNPKKNINKAIEGFHYALNDFPDLQLVITGGDFNIDKKKISERLIILAHVSDQDLLMLYNSCEIFIYYSLYEGFGLPLLEALKCKSVTIASDIETHREITKRAILYANPEKPKDLYHKIKLALTKKDISNRIREKGLKIASSYSWKETAKMTKDVYRFILNNNV